MYVRITYPKIQCFDNNGLPAVGYKIYTYVAGTVSTPATTYSDRLLSVPNTNPVTLNSRGEADIYVGAAVKLVFTTPTGDPTSPIWAVDYVGEQQSNFVTGEATLGTTHNNYVVTTIPAVAALYNNLTLIMTPDVDNTDTIGTTTFNCSGINDGVFSGPYLGSTSGLVFTAQIDNTNLSPPGAPTAALSATAGVVTAGNHYVKVTFVNATGESLPGTASGVVAADGTHKIDLSNIPTGTRDVTSRKIYMTKAGGSTYYYVGTISDNVTLTYSINAADADLTVVAPSTNTSYDSFKWKKDGGDWTTGVQITGAAQILAEGVAITFAVTTGHTYDDLWAVTVETPARVNLDALGNLIVYKNKGGSTVALDGKDMKARYPAQLVMNQDLNAWLLMNPATPIFSTPTITAIMYRKNLTSAYDLVIGDQGYELSCVGTFTITLLTPPQFANRYVYIKNAGTGVITVDAGASYKIYGNGTSTLTIAPNAAILIESNSVDWHVLNVGGLSLAAAPINATAATSATFSNLLPGTRYRLVAQLQHLGDINVFGLRFNADAGATYYFVNIYADPVATPTAWCNTTSYIPLEWTNITVGCNTGFEIEFITEDGNNYNVSVTGKSVYPYSSTYPGNMIISARYAGAADLTSVSVIATAGTANFTGKLYLYKYG